MAKTPLTILFFFCSLQCLSFTRVNANVGPTLYVFGDSLSEVGNNIFLPGALAKATYKPYGIDFPNGTFGRLANGFTLAEHIAKLLGLPLPLPVLDPRSQNTSSIQGFNYASSSAGILSDTGVKFAGENLCLEKQIGLFKKTAQDFLPSRLRNQHDVTQHLRNSIFFILIGSNDYSLNYANPNFSNNMQKYNPQQFAELLVDKLGNHIQELYKLGARKFIVSEIGPIGCTPSAISFMHPKTKCVDQLNVLVTSFNVKLANMATELGKILGETTFVTMKGDFLAQLINNPKAYGFEDAVNPCCTVMGGVQCVPDLSPCQNRQSHVFFDAAHTTDAVNKVIAETCVKGVGACSPISISQLFQQT